MQRTMQFFLGVVTLAAIGLGLAKIIEVLSHSPDENRFRAYVLFRDAQGLRPGTRVVYRGMTVGSVEKLTLDTVDGNVRVLLAMDPQAAALMRSNTQAWIVRPRFGGLTGELSGLDTLIKESYLRVRDRPGGFRLRTREELLGMEKPPRDLAQEELPRPQTGDLLASVLVPAKHGLDPGHPVLFRGITVGEVRDVSLTADGLGVIVAFRVRRPFRAMVREGSRFWIARPILHGNLIAGVTVDDLGSLLSPSLVFDSPEDGDSSVASDQTVFVGLDAPPKKVEPWVEDAVVPEVASMTAEPSLPALESFSPWVEVRYQAIENDLFSGDDDIEANGEGVLYRGPSNEVFVLTARSACDGEYFAKAGFLDRLSISDERIRVVLDDGRVWPAQRRWVDADDHDIALLQVQVPEEAADLSLPPWNEYLDFSRESLEDIERPQEEGDQGDELRLVRPEDVCLGLFGREDVVSLNKVPAELRPEGS